MTVAYELIRSKRRTIAIVIDSEGKCRVRAPLQARLSDIEHFVQAKTGWIEQKQQHYAAVQKKRQLILTDGMQLSVLDNSYTLRLTEVGQVQELAATAAPRPAYPENSPRQPRQAGTRRYQSTPPTTTTAPSTQAPPLLGKVELAQQRLPSGWISRSGAV